MPAKTVLAPPAEELLDTKNAARRLTISPRTLNRMVADGKIAVYRIGTAEERSYPRYWIRDLDRAIAASRVEAKR